MDKEVGWGKGMSVVVMVEKAWVMGMLLAVTKAVAEGGGGGFDSVEDVKGGGSSFRGG